MPQQQGTNAQDMRLNLAQPRKHTKPPITFLRSYMISDNQIRNEQAQPHI